MHLCICSLSFLSYLPSPFIPGITFQIVYLQTTFVLGSVMVKLPKTLGRHPHFLSPKFSKYCNPMYNFYFLKWQSFVSCPKIKFPICTVNPITFHTLQELAPSSIPSLPFIFNYSFPRDSTLQTTFSGFCSTLDFSLTLDSCSFIFTFLKDECTLVDPLSPQLILPSIPNIWSYSVPGHHSTSYYFLKVTSDFFIY